MRVTVLGTGYEGLTISTGLAILGHKVTVVDTRHRRARQLQRGVSEEIDTEFARQMKMVLREGLLLFTSEPENSLAEADIVILASVSGSNDGRWFSRSAILRSVECLSGATASFSTIVITARVPAGSCRLLQTWLNDAMYTGKIHVVACPLFLEKPDGLREFLEPERIVLGYENEDTRRVMDAFFAPILLNDPLVLHVSWEAAEMMRLSDGKLEERVVLGEPA